MCKLGYLSEFQVSDSQGLTFEHWWEYKVQINICDEQKSILIRRTAHSARIFTASANRKGLRYVSGTLEEVGRCP